MTMFKEAVTTCESNNDLRSLQRSTHESKPRRHFSPPFLRPSPLQQFSNEMKGQSTNKTISKNESLRCVNALLIPVSKFHPPAVCGPLMRNKTPRSRDGGRGVEREWVDALATP